MTSWFLGKKVLHEKRKREDERRGRIHAEKRLRQLSSHSVSDGAKQLVFHPIGRVLAGFRDRRGTPRQFGLASHVRSVIQLERRVQPESSLQGLEQYSHIWVLAHFHENTNSAKTQIAAKIRAPRAPERVGIYGTRTPHRHNALALSVARIESIDFSEGQIWVTGLDLLDNTPVLDIKPYISRYDSISNSLAPLWVSEDIDGVDLLDVDLDVTKEQLETVAASCDFVRSGEELALVLIEILSRDIRSRHQRSLSGSESDIYELRFDHAHVRYRISSNVTVLSVMSLRAEPR